MSDTVTVRAVLCADGSEHWHGMHDYPASYSARAVSANIASADSEMRGCGPHYVAERTVVTSEWRRVED